MNRLKDHTCYLMGSIDRSSDGGRLWRQNITPFLQGLEIGVFNPCDKPIYNTHINEDENFVAKVQKLKEDKLYSEVSDIMQEIVRIDLNFVDLCNFSILNIVPTIHMCGSYAEQTVACLQRKPVIVHCEEGVSQIPNWLFGVCDHDMFFDSWKQVESYIQHIATDSIVDDNDKKWRFINYNKVYSKEPR